MAESPFPCMQQECVWREGVYYAWRRIEESSERNGEDLVCVCVCVSQQGVQLEDSK